MGAGERHPIQAGFVAVAACAVALGLVAGGVAILGSHLVGLGGSASAANAATLYVPDVTPSPSALGETGEQIGLPIPKDTASAPDVADGTPTPTDTSSPVITTSPTPTPTPTSSSSPTTSASPPPTSSSVTPPAVISNISLSASPASVAAMAPIQLIGRFPGGDGHVMLVERKEPGDTSWHSFPVPGVAVAGGTFTQVIQIGKTGLSYVRMVDQDTHAVSNAVTVTVS